jgi:hypothetical protein
VAEAAGRQAAGTGTVAPAVGGADGEGAAGGSPVKRRRLNGGGGGKTSGGAGGGGTDSGGGTSGGGGGGGNAEDRSEDSQLKGAGYEGGPAAGLLL